MPPRPSLTQLNLRRDLWDLRSNTTGALTEITCQPELRVVDQSERSRTYRDGVECLGDGGGGGVEPLDPPPVVDEGKITSAGEELKHSLPTPRIRCL